MKVTYNLFLILVLSILFASCSNGTNSDSEQEKSTSTNQMKSNENPKDNDNTTYPNQSNDDSEESNIHVESQDHSDSSNEDGTVPEEPIESSNTTISTEVKNSDTSDPEDKQPAYDFHAYKNLDALLKKYVSSSGKVNYSGIKGNKASLDKIIKEFKDNYPASNWTKNQKLCYYINAYNIFTIKLIVDNYPTTSITKITAKPWDKKFVKLGSHTYSLNNVENDIIRKKFNEPRIHFALNCASKSCPVLLNAAYTSKNLNSKLTSQTKRFLNDTSKNKFDNKKKVYISKIFDWYGDDFKKNGSTIIGFINKYRTDQLNNPKVLFTEYSWDLNN